MEVESRSGLHEIDSSILVISPSVCDSELRSESSTTIALDTHDYLKLPQNENADENACQQSLELSSKISELISDQSDENTTKPKNVEQAIADGMNDCDGQTTSIQKDTLQNVIIVEEDRTAAACEGIQDSEAYFDDGKSFIECAAAHMDTSALELSASSECDNSTIETKPLDIISAKEYTELTGDDNGIQEQQENDKLIKSTDETQCK